MSNYFQDNEALAFQLQHPLMQRIVTLKEEGFTKEAESAYAPHDVADALENYRQVLSIIGEVVAETLAPNAERVDAEGPEVVDGRVHYHPGTQQNHDTLTQAGVYGLPLPREYDGLNFPIVPYVMSAELVSRADAGFANIWGLQDCAETIYEFGSEEQKRRYLPLAAQGKTFAMSLTEPDAGSDLQSVQLQARFDEQSNTWRLNGVKRFITNGDADISLVLARSEAGTKDARGLSLFLYRKESLAVKVRRIEHKMGIVGSPTCELVFQDAPAELVGDRKMGLIKYVMSLMNGARLGVGAQSVGVMEAAYRAAALYAHDREQFGQAISQFQPVRELLALMRAKVDACRSLLYETTRYVDMAKALTHLQNEKKLEAKDRPELKNYQRLADLFTPLTKLFASEMANQVCYDALQIHGGTGFMKDFPVERLYRDARILPIYEGTSQLQVVAAIRSVTSGVLAARLEEFDAQCAQTELPQQLAHLREMMQTYKEAVAHVQDAGSEQYHDFHARRLVEMGGLVAMGYLLLLDTQREPRFAASARIFVQYAYGMVQQHMANIMGIAPEALEDYQPTAWMCAEGKE